MLKDESLEYIQEQFEEKAGILENYGEAVNTATFYEDIFYDLEMELPVVTIDEDNTEKKIQAMPLYSAIDYGTGRNDVLIGGCTYFNNWISKKSAKDIHTFIIDLDNAYSNTLLRALQHGWKNEAGEQYAMPTYIVNSGTGLHLYFVLSEPIPNYHKSTSDFDKLYRSLAKQQAKRVYIQEQIQWFGQDFRCVGGLNKYGWENIAYKVGDKWDIDELAKAVGLNIHFTRYGEKRTTKPASNSKYKRKKRTGWKTNRAFYDYTLKNCIDKTHEGNRYLSMCGLSVVAWKCNVPQEELEKDLLNLLPIYNKGATRQIKDKEVYTAMKMYNDRAMLTQRASIENWQGWEYKPQIKRNGRKQKTHLKIARATLDIMNEEQGKALQGRPTKQAIIEKWQAEHPQGTKAQCIKDTGISKPTVYKYWRDQTIQYSKQTILKAIDKVNGGK